MTDNKNGGGQPLASIHTEFISDPSEDRLIVKRTQDVEPHLNDNKVWQNHVEQKGDFRRIGSIPFVVIEKFITEKGINLLTMSGEELSKVCQRILDDPDYEYLRTTPKRHHHKMDPLRTRY